MLVSSPVFLGELAYQVYISTEFAEHRQPLVEIAHYNTENIAAYVHVNTVSEGKQAARQLLINLGVKFNTERRIRKKK